MEINQFPGSAMCNLFGGWREIGPNGQKGMQCFFIQCVFAAIFFLMQSFLGYGNRKKSFPKLPFENV